MSSLGLPKEFERQVRQIRQYLSGEGVDVTDFNATIEDATAYQSIRTGVRPENSRLEWLNPSVAPAVLEVAATGPKAMAIGAAHGDRVSVIESMRLGNRPQDFD